MAKSSASNASEVFRRKKIVSTTSMLETAKTIGFGTRAKCIMPGLPGIARDTKCRTARSVGEWDWGRRCTAGQKKGYNPMC